MLGAAPHPQWDREREDNPSGSRQFAIAGPLQPRADDTPSRRLRSCSLAAFIHAFAELPLLTWPHLALPLLHTADPAGDSLFLSPLGSTVAASQLRSGMRGVSKNRERLAPGSIPAHADPCGDYRQQRHGNCTLQVRHAYATMADCTPSCLQSMSL